MEQHLLTEGPLLNEEGNLNEAGYALSLVKKYDRNLIKAGKSRIKEWDYYYVGNKKRGIAICDGKRHSFQLRNENLCREDDPQSLHFRQDEPPIFLKRRGCSVPKQRSGDEIPP